jgi:hypothetical protein
MWARGLDLGGAGVGLPGVGPEGFHRRADRQGFAAPIRDHAPVGRDGGDALHPFFTLVGEELALPDLEVDRPRGQGREAAEQQGQGQAHAPALQVQVQEGMGAVSHQGRAFASAVVSAPRVIAQHIDARRLGDGHAQAAARHLFHPVVHQPGGNLQLQLTPLHVQITATGLFGLERHKQFARLVAR